MAPQALRARIESRVARRREGRFPRTALYGLAALAAAAALAIAASFVLTSAPRARRESALAELADVHATNLASERRVEVVSSDRHVVKPWFQGRLPFAVDFPEGDVAPFTLLGGRVAYVGGAPAAHLLFGRALHVLSVFVVPEGSPLAGATTGAGASRRNGFGIRAVRRRDLVYVIVGDVSDEDLDRLAAIFSQKPV
jgi:anti-sigma factor RsiW